MSGFNVGPKGPDFFTLSDVGANRHLAHDGPMVLEQLSDGRWSEIARFGTPEEAATGLDEKVASGVGASDLRLKPLPKERFRWLRRR
jgi:hypothetical protein